MPWRRRGREVATLRQRVYVEYDVRTGAILQADPGAADNPVLGGLARQEKAVLEKARELGAREICPARAGEMAMGLARAGLSYTDVRLAARLRAGGRPDEKLERAVREAGAWDLYLQSLARGELYGPEAIWVERVVRQEFPERGETRKKRRRAA